MSYLDGVFQSLSQKVVIVRNLEFPIQNFLCTRSFAVDGVWSGPLCSLVVGNFDT